uniref:Uncharacterized protein n=1 Tax=Panagrolaimus davidi TaxID=227884 RepID=A0A914QZL4_9BILA
MSSPPPKRNLILYVENKGPMIITSFNIETQQILQCSIPFDTFQMFQTIQSSFYLQQIKAIAFILNENAFLTFMSAYNFRQKCYEFCKENGIFYLFVSSNVIYSSMALLLYGNHVKNGEEISLLFFAPDETLLVMRIKRMSKRYQIVNDLQIQNIILDENFKALILGNHKPKKIILVRSPFDPIGYMDAFYEFFRNENPIILSSDAVTFHNAIVNTVLHFMCEIYNQFIVELPCIHTFLVCYENVKLLQKYPFLKLPFEKSAIVDVDPTKYISLIVNPTCTGSFDELLKNVKLSNFDCKKVKVTLKVDINSFYDFKIEPFKEELSPDSKHNFCTFKKEKELGENLSKQYFVKSDSLKQSSIKAKLQFSQDDYYFVLDNGKDASEKIPIYISFVEKQPIIGNSAKEMFNVKPEFIVYDIIQLCSNSSLIFVNPKWKFSLSKSDDSSLMVTFKTLDGERQANPMILLAMIIKDGINKIQKEINAILDEIEIGFDGFIPNKFLKQNFEKAAERLKIGISFC